MSKTINELRSNNTSGVPCLRLNRRRGYLVIDVTWYEERRRSTSIPVGTRPLAAVERAMCIRAARVGARYDMTPRAAWQRLKLSWRQHGGR